MHTHRRLSKGSGSALKTMRAHQATRRQCCTGCALPGCPTQHCKTAGHVYSLGLRFGIGSLERPDFAGAAAARFRAADARRGVVLEHSAVHFEVPANAVAEGGGEIVARAILVARGDARRICLARSAHIDALGVLGCGCTRG